MSKIDRTTQEKTVQLGPWKVKLGTICILGLVIIMVGSSLGYLAGQIGQKEPEQQQKNENQIQAQVVVRFDENNTIQNVISLESGKRPQDALGKIVNLTTADTKTGKIITAVSYNDINAANADDYQWTLYINGRLIIGNIAQNAVNNGDLIYLNYEKKIF